MCALPMGSSRPKRCKGRFGLEFKENALNEIENLTFEQSFTELEETVRKLEAGGLTLEESLALFERGQALAARCSAQLDQSELKIRQLSPEGAVPFEPQG
jgi:exodeoxyribonuclease VII small subunit